MGEQLHIRGVEPHEHDIVASLTVDAYAEFAAVMSPDAWSAFAHDIADVAGRLRTAEVLVAQRQGHLVGTATRYGDWRGAQEGTSAVRLLAVPPAERGRGVGHALMEECIARSRGEGKQHLVLTAPPEMTMARELWESLGFVRDVSLDHQPAPGIHSEGWRLAL